MPKLIWDEIGKRIYETGVKRGVLFKKTSEGYATGVPWNGLTAVTESPSGAEPTPMYAGDIKYVTILSNEEYAGTIEAYTYPPEFAECNGEKSPVQGVYLGQQSRSAFGFCWTSTVGNDVDYNDHGYKIHIVWNALAAVSERAHATINDSPEAMTMSWEFSTTPVTVDIPGYTPTAKITIDSTTCDPDALAALEKMLYGDTDGSSTLPDITTVLTTLGYQAEGAAG